MSKNSHPNNDEHLQQLQEWRDALQDVAQIDSPELAEKILLDLFRYAQQLKLKMPASLTTPYINTLSADRDNEYPGDMELENKITALIRWNAVAMVLHAGKKAPELGGHIATYASSAWLYEVAFHYFFRSPTANKAGDLVYFQGHGSPGIYARAYLEGRFPESQLEHFRQEIETKGLSSYPHPWLMPDFWQFATVSMGLGPLQAIYQARFLKYLNARGLSDTTGRKVWAFLGDGEMDEVESLGALTVAAREKLDNLIFVVNCNLQRLDGPVRGNSKIIQELESMFHGAGWTVIKVIWGSNWDALLEKDKSGLLIQRMNECIDGEYQNFRAKNGAYIREQFFNKYPELKALVADMSDEEIWALKRGGHDPKKIFAAYTAAMSSENKPVVILAKTVKGYGMGAAGEGQNITHQQKKMSPQDLLAFRDRFKLPLSDEEAIEAKFYRPSDDSPEITYLRERRKALGGAFPVRTSKTEPLSIPSLETFSALLTATGERHISTTMAFVRFLNLLLRDKNVGPRVVPIVPDESRTFGMEGLFRQIGIYSIEGQLYTPVDADQVMPYKEIKNGQILQEGINEAGAMASWIAAATSYSNNNFAMMPFYIYYSMFGFQRVMDLAWAAADMQARGFLLGATAGRTTLAGEGLQHQDGHSLILGGLIPNCKNYDPAYHYELAAILQHGLVEMYQECKNVFYYITLMNENYEHPDMPKYPSIQEDIVKGMYQLKQGKEAKIKVQLLGSGTILNEVRKAADWLETQGISSDIWSVTSFNELFRDGAACERQHRLNPEASRPISHVEKCLGKVSGPIIAASDYVRLYAEQIRPFIGKQTYITLGTDGFGRSGTRAQLRHFFEVDANAIAHATMKALFDEGLITLEQLKKAQTELAINPNKPNPIHV